MAVSMTRVPVREQEPLVRAKNFEEVCLGPAYPVWFLHLSHLSRFPYPGRRSYKK